MTAPAGILSLCYRYLSLWLATPFVCCCLFPLKCLLLIYSTTTQTHKHKHFSTNAHIKFNNEQGPFESNQQSTFKQRPRINHQPRRQTSTTGRGQPPEPNHRGGPAWPTLHTPAKPRSRGRGPEHTAKRAVQSVELSAQRYVLHDRRGKSFYLCAFLYFCG